MNHINRRNLIKVAAGLAGASLLPFRLLAAENDTLRMAISAEVGSLDLLQNVSPLHTYSLVFEPLIQYGENGNLMPGLAESWKVSEDGRTISFTLRQDVTFSDGTPFDAEAAKWGLERWMGKKDFSWIGVSAAMESINVTGSHTFDLKLKSAVPVALMELTIIRPVRFLSPKAVDASGNQSAPIGTGPWVITENSNAGTTLTRNETYWGKKPTFSKIELRVVPDELSRSNALRSGDLDVIGGDWIAPLSPRRARALEQTSGVKVGTAAGTAAVLLTFSPRSKIFTDAATREAVNLSIDRNSIVKIIYEGFAVPTANMIPASIPASGTVFEVPARDVETARAKLEAAGWEASGEGWTRGGAQLTVDFMVSDESLPGSRRMAELLQQQLVETGFAVNVSAVDNATIHDRRQSFEYDLTFMVTYGAPYDPHGTIANLLLSSVDSGPDGKIYASPELDPIIEAGLAAPDATRAEAMQKIFDWLQANSAVVPMVVPERLWAYRDRVTNFVIPAHDYDMPVDGVILT